MLIGAIFGISIVLITCLWTLAPKWLGLPPDINAELELSSLLGIRGFTRIFSDTLITSVFMPMAYLFLLLLLTILLRKEWVAVGVVWLTFALALDLIGHNPSIDWIFAGLEAGILIFLLVRYGLLAAIFAEFFWNLGLMLPLTSDFSTWYGPNAIFALGSGVALVVYGFYISTAGEPLFKGGFIQD
jgi:hypothetical protein